MSAAAKKAAKPAKALPLPEASSLLWSQHDKLTAISDYAHAISLCVAAIGELGHSEKDACAIDLLVGHIQDEADAVSNAISTADRSIRKATQPAILAAVRAARAKPNERPK